jgi:hypothetical protein
VQAAQQSPLAGLHWYGEHTRAAPSGGTEASLSSEHTAVFARHEPVAASHANPGAQSAFVVHFVRQAPLPHAKGEHEEVSADGTQAPSPLQRGAARNVVPSQLPGPHVFSGPLANAAHLVRSFDPSHASAAQTLPPSAHAGLPARGAPSTGEQVPSAPGTLQASHWPAQDVSQHTPSAQMPVAHSLLVLHVLPLVFFTHLPASGPADVPAQTKPVGHAATSQQTFTPSFSPGRQCLLVQSASSSQSVPSAPVVMHTPDLQA